MANLLLLALVARLVVGVAGAMSFLNPPSYSNLKGDTSRAISYKQGQVVNVVWTPADPGQAASLVLWQLDNKTAIYFGDMEYLTQGAVGVTKYQWLVGTRKNLSVSNLFYFSIFQEGKTGPADDNSEYLYINKDEAAQPVTSSVATTISIVPSPTSTVTSMTASMPPKSTVAQSALPSPTSSNPSANPSSTEAASSAFSTSAKIGMGIGIPVALALGLGIGYLVFRRHKKADDARPTHPLNATSFAVPQEIKYQYDSSHYGSHLYEAPPRSPVEIARSRNDNSTRPYYQSSSQSESIRYEM